MTWVPREVAVIVPVGRKGLILQGPVRCVVRLLDMHASAGPGGYGACQDFQRLDGNDTPLGRVPALPF